VSPTHRTRLQPQMLGSSHERGLRAGTLATHQIVGFGLACELVARKREVEAVRLTALREQLWRGLADLPGVLRNGRAGAPHILNVSFPGVEGESLFTGLPELALSTGSACNSRNAEPSFVLRALGRDTEAAQSSLRFSLGHSSTIADVEAAIVAVRRVHAQLWAKSPARGIGALINEAAPSHPGAGSQASPSASRPGQEWWVGEAGAERLGSWIRLAASVEDGQIRAARHQAYGCPETLAACSLLIERLPGHKVAAPDVGSPREWAETVRAPIEKLGRMLIIEDALNALKPL